MSSSSVVDIMGQALLLTAKLAGPFLIANVVVGLLVSLVQSVFSVQEQSLSFVPKLAACGLVIIVLGPWMLGQLTGFVTTLFGHAAGLASS